MQILDGSCKWYIMKVPKGYQIHGIRSGGHHTLEFNDLNFQYIKVNNNDSMFGGRRLSAGKMTNSFKSYIEKMSRKSKIEEIR